MSEDLGFDFYKEDILKACHIEDKALEINFQEKTKDIISKIELK